MLKMAFREEPMDRTQTYEWWKRFKEGRNSVDDDPRSERPSTSKTDDNVANVREVIGSNRRLTVREVAEDVSISKTVCHEILTENLCMKDLMRGERMDGCSNMTTRPHIHRSFSVTSWPNTQRLSFHSLRTLQISHQLTFFSVSKAQINAERPPFWVYRGNHDKFASAFGHHS